MPVILALLLMIPVVAVADRNGLSAERLARIDAITDGYIEAGYISGTVVLVTRDGRTVYERTNGTLGFENPAPMQVDSIFRIHSMTKVVTAVAALILYEEGHFHLNDPVAKFLPAYAEMRVFDGEGTRAADQPVTMRQLFTHMTGIGYRFYYPDPDAMSALNLASSSTAIEFANRLAAHPLLFEPGEAWRYGYSIDVLGAVVEAISGQRLGDFMRERIFESLGMKDTAFEVPAEKLDRLASNYNFDKDKGQPVPRSVPPFEAGMRMYPYDAGGAGLFSTAPDYLRFLEMLRGGGVLGKTRILGTKTVAYMMKDHLPERITAANVGPDHDPMLGLGAGHGLGIGIYFDPVRRGVLSSAGENDWGGAAGTLYWIDPVEDIVVVGMVQMLNKPFLFREDLAVGIYQSLTESRED